MENATEKNKKYVDEYILDCKTMANQTKQNTIRNKQKALNRLVKHFNKDIKQLSETEIKQYYVDLTDKKI